MIDRPHVVIVGGGVIGISSAIALLDHPVSPCNVTLIATDLPSLDTSTYSPDSLHAAPSSYSSAWAGAHHVSDAKNAKQLQQDKITFQVFQKLEKERGYGATPSEADSAAALVWVHQTEYWEYKEDFNADAIEWYPDYKPLPLSALPEGVEFGCTLSTYDIVVPQYLPRLYRMFSSLGGKSVNSRVESISEALKLAQENTHSIKPSAILISPGLGAKEMLGDNNIHPVRGQTILVRAPWCTTTLNKEMPWASNLPNPHTWPGMSRVNKDGFRDMYILPRGDGNFIVGGTRLVNDYDTEPRQNTSTEILQRALSFMPALVNPNQSNSPNESHVDVVGVNVGLRPARKGGPRLESGELVNDTPVIYSYGYGGYGYQCSWGAAFDARDLIDDALKRSRAPRHSMLASLTPDLED